MDSSANHEHDKIVVVIDPDLEDLIPGFFEYRRQDIDKMRAALATGDYETIRLLGHGMKGAGGGYGFDAITDIGRTLEFAARMGDGATIEAGIAELESYLERVEVVYGDVES